MWRPLLVLGPSWFLTPPAAKSWRRACIVVLACVPSWTRFRPAVIKYSFFARSEIEDLKEKQLQELKGLMNKLKVERCLVTKTKAVHLLQAIQRT